MLQPFQRVVARVSGLARAVAVRPFVVAGQIDQRRLEAVEHFAGAHIDVVVAGGNAAFDVADMHRERRPQRIDAGDQALHMRNMGLAIGHVAHCGETEAIGGNGNLRRQQQHQSRDG